MFKVIEGFGHIEKDTGRVRTVRIKPIEQTESENVKKLKEEWKRHKEEKIFPNT